MSSNPILTDAQEKVLDDLQKVLRRATENGVLDLIAVNEHPDVVNKFADAVRRLLHVPKKIGCFTMFGEEYEVLTTNVVINGKPSVEVVNKRPDGSRMAAIWHYEELDPVSSKYHAVILAMLTCAEQRY